MKTKNNAKKFYRSNLSTIVWDKDKQKPMADFSEGYFITEDENVIKVLKGLGYPEVPLDSTEPPQGIIINQPSRMIDGDVPLMSPAMNEKLMERKMEAKSKIVEQPIIKPKLKRRG